MSQWGWGYLTLPWGCRWGGLETPRQKWLICMVSFGRRWGEVERAARDLGEGKAPQAWKSPYRGSQSDTLVLEQISCYALNP